MDLSLVGVYVSRLILSIFVSTQRNMFLCDIEHRVPSTIEHFRIECRVANVLDESKSHPMTDAVMRVMFHYYFDWIQGYCVLYTHTVASAIVVMHRHDTTRTEAHSHTVHPFRIVYGVNAFPFRFQIN